MPNTTKLAPQRLAICKLWLDAIRDLVGVHFDHDQFGAAAGELMLCIAVLIGQLEGRPMSVSKLATYTGVPRVTAIRKLRSLHERKIISRAESGHYMIDTKRMNGRKAIAVALRNIHRVRVTAEKLSKLDSGEIASS